MRDILAEDGDHEAANPTLLDASSSFQGNWRSIVALIIILLVGSVANSAGVGGGAIFVPILQSMVGFSLKDSTAISQALITAGSAVSVAINIFKRSPVNPSTCIIHFSVALALTPVVLVGVSVGVLLNSILPNWILTIMLIVLIFGLSVQSIMKGVNMWEQENKRKAEAKQENQAPSLPLPPSMNGAAMDDEAAQSIACCEPGSTRGNSRIGSQGELPLFRRTGASGTSAAYESMEVLPVSSKAVGEGKAGVGNGDLTSSVQQPRTLPLFGRASLDLERGQLRQGAWAGRDAALVAAPSGLNSFLDALLGPVAEDIVYRQHQPEVDEGSWVQRRNRRAWRMLLQSGGELGQQFVPDAALDGGHSGLTGAAKHAAAEEAANRMQHTPLLPGEQRSCHQPITHMGRPKPVQPPLPAAEAGDIIDRLDSPMGFSAISNPMHEDGPSGFMAISNPLHENSSEPSRQQQQQQQLQQELEQQEGARGLDSGFSQGELPTQPTPKQSLLSRFRKRSKRFRTDLQRVPRRSVALMSLTWAIFVLLQVLRTRSSKCSVVYYLLLALQLATMLAIGMGIATYMQRKVNASKEARKAEEGDEEGVELTPMRRPSKDFSVAQIAAETNPKGPEDMTLAPQLNGTVHIDRDNNPSPPPMPAASQQQGPAPLESPSNPLGETGKALAVSLSFCCFAGLVAGLLGLGGGMIIGPLLMGLKVHPQVAAATSSLMVVFSSSAALISFAVDGRVNGAYAGVFSAAAVIASVAGVLVVNEKVKRSGRTSIVVFMLATIMVLGFCVITAFGVIGMVHDFSTGQNIGTHSLCKQ